MLVCSPASSKHQLFTMMCLLGFVLGKVSPLSQWFQILQLRARLSVKVTIFEVDRKRLSNTTLKDLLLTFVSHTRKTQCRGFLCNNGSSFCKTGVTTCCIYIFLLFWNPWARRKRWRKQLRKRTETANHQPPLHTNEKPLFQSPHQLPGSRNFLFWGSKFMDRFIQKYIFVTMYGEGCQLDLL